ncbi:hypothetical protein RclHR1_26630001 [Rhizophagus clarus]|uniref:Protein kinase domain-containing protein n=1 Tax=Rhizophagus clarus TaxID=94130 RepID=A0A2Z6R1C6_9GLOM|nr:hypothetical protein RclHR1_26630001 [Rhizophagus clarus]
MDKASQIEKSCPECENPVENKSNLCLTCITCHIQVKIDEFIKYTQTSAHNAELAIQWADWKEFTNIKKIGWVVLAEALYHCYNQENSNFCVKGFTQESISMQYYIITDYAENGGLCKYLQKNPNFSWKDQLYIIWDISLDLERIHKTGLIHRDIHAGNILHIGKISHFDDGVEVHSGVAYISDFSFSMAACFLHNNADKVYGVMHYMAPEMLNEMGYLMESDIYSIGIIMWEIASEKQPFAQFFHDACLALEIYYGLHPEPTPNIPPFYIQLMHSCWHKDPSKRPKAKEIREMIEKRWELFLQSVQKMQLIKVEENKKTTGKIDNNKIDPNNVTHKSSTASGLRFLDNGQDVFTNVSIFFLVGSGLQFLDDGHGFRSSILRRWLWTSGLRFLDDGHSFRSSILRRWLWASGLRFLDDGHGRNECKFQNF